MFFILSRIIKYIKPLFSFGTVSEAPFVCVGVFCPLGFVHSSDNLPHMPILCVTAVGEISLAPPGSSSHTHCKFALKIND